MLYEIRESAMLSDEAKALEPADLDAHARIAESLLGLRSPAGWTGADAEMAALAVARQVSLQVRLDVDMQVLLRVTRGERSEDYREVLPEVDSMAQRIIGMLPDSGKVTPAQLYATWPTVRTLRPTVPGSVSPAREVHLR